MEGLKQINGIGRWQLTAHMQVMVCAQQVFTGAQVQRFKHGFPVAATQAFVVGVAHAQSVKDRGDARGRHLCIVGQQRGQRGPLHFGPGHQVPLKVVGVHLDKTGHEVVALHVPALRFQRSALVDRMDAPVFDGDAAQHLFGGQHQAGIFKHNGAHGALLNWVTSTRRVATAAPTCAS